MAKRILPKPPMDPVEASNRKILADRQARIAAARPVLPDLGLKLPEPKEPETAAEFIDEFDKRAFGYGDQATITKIIYGPDPLVDHSPSFREALERHGREDLAALYCEAIVRKGAAAMPDPLLMKSMQLAIDKFGAEAIAVAFRDRILRIPMKTVEIDASDQLDPEVLGSSVLTETIRRYERPGMEYRFFTKACLDRFGWRGYTPVKDSGDIVTAGTLMLGEISRHQVELRRRRLDALAREKLAGIAETHEASQEELLRQARDEGVHTAGISGLMPGEMVTARAGVGGDDPDEYLGRSRAAGVEIGKE